MASSPDVLVCKGCGRGGAAAQGRRRRGGILARARHHQTAVGAAEAEAVGHGGFERPVPPLPQDRHVGEGRIEGLDMRAFRHEVVLVFIVGINL